MLAVLQAITAGMDFTFSTAVFEGCDVKGIKATAERLPGHYRCGINDSSVSLQEHIEQRKELAAFRGRKGTESGTLRTTSSWFDFGEQTASLGCQCKVHAAAIAVTD